MTPLLNPQQFARTQDFLHYYDTAAKNLDVKIGATIERWHIVETQYPDDDRHFEEAGKVLDLAADRYINGTGTLEDMKQAIRVWFGVGKAALLKTRKAAA